MKFAFGDNGKLKFALNKDGQNHGDGGGPRALGRLPLPLTELW